MNSNRKKNIYIFIKKNIIKFLLYTRTVINFKFKNKINNKLY